jgi:TRAP-type mannitol/chloroaromatic compound transport system substrate-binding protein
MAVAAWGVAAAPANAAEQWSMATSWAGGPLLEMAAKPAAATIELLTRGDVKFQVFPGGTLGSPLKVTETVRAAVAEGGHSWNGYDWGIDKTTVIFGGYAGGLNGEQNLHWLYQGGGKELYREFRLEKFGVISIPCGALPAEMGLHSRKKIQHMDDFKGVKLRTAGAWAEISQGFGISAVILPEAEVYPALERGVVDAIEWAQLSINWSAGYHKVAKYLIMPGIHQPSSMQECTFNKAKWDALSDANKKAVEIAGQITTMNFYQQVGDNDLKAARQYVDAGNEIVVLDQDVVDKAKELAFAWADKIAAQEGPNSWFKKALDHQRAYQKQWDKSRAWRATAVDPK